MIQRLEWLYNVAVVPSKILVLNLGCNQQEKALVVAVGTNYLAFTAISTNYCLLPYLDVAIDGQVSASSGWLDQLVEPHPVDIDNDNNNKDLIQSAARRLLPRQPTTEVRALDSPSRCINSFLL